MPGTACLPRGEDLQCLNKLNMSKHDVGKNESRGQNHVWVVGYLEQADDQLPIPILLVYLPAPDINPSMFMRGWITSPAKDFDVMRLRTALMGHGDGGVTVGSSELISMRAALGRYIMSTSCEWQNTKDMM
ncbi:hypothetical protein EDC04DRAFT_2609841 [Pisolithus marmoratus]|nr:hypothetical protein EDC04DRAFT_2609841 [Pisolithus marmoratus]